MATIQTAIRMSDYVSGTLSNIVNVLNMTVGAFQNVQHAARDDIDASAFEGLRRGVDAATMATQRFSDELSQIQPPEPIEIPVIWNAPRNMDIFQGAGAERLAQEMGSLDSAINSVLIRQNMIGQQALSMNILPPNAQADFVRIDSRIQSLKSQLQRLQESGHLELGADRAAAQMESLRSQIMNAQRAQNDLNSAMERMDVSGANDAYNRLNSIIDSTQQNIRDNANEQENFNQKMKGGHSLADDLKGKIMGMAAAYMSIRGVGMVLGLSDELTQTTARLNMINDGMQTTKELQDKIFLSAQRAGASYQMTSDVVAKLGLQAGKAFGSNNELIAFSEQLNKSFSIAGTSAQGVESVMYNLTQALSSGVLRGQDLNSVFSNAQPIIQNIADYLEVDIGQIKKMAAEGELSASVVKNAMLAAAEATNAEFAEMPTTFGQAVTRIKNNAIMAFEPVLQRITQIANSPEFMVFAQNATDALVFASGVALQLFDIISTTAGFLADNWSIVAPLITAAGIALGIYNGYLIVSNAVTAISNGLAAVKAARLAMTTIAQGAETTATFAATAAQYGLNAALLACPITWIIVGVLAIIAIFYAVVAIINKVAGTSVSATGVIFGAFAWLGSVVANIFMGLLELVLGVINYMINPFIEIANFIGNVFTNPVSSIIYLFQGMADNVLAILQKIASALDFVFGSNMADAVGSWRSGLNTMADNAVAKYAPNENYTKVIDSLDLSVSNTLGWNRLDNTDAFDAGYAAGENLEATIANFDPASMFPSNIPNPADYPNSFGEFDPVGVGSGVTDIADNTRAMKNASEEDLKYLRDIAERETINRFTTAEVTVEFGGITNNVGSEMDLDGVVAYINQGVIEALEVTAAGVYS
ncbi:membrane protein [Clostridia bacterium]|nr:membrane protein [Clostridia bacterium]GHV34972.1 membrane protein [Clostridia bacterium]